MEDQAGDAVPMVQHGNHQHPRFAPGHEKHEGLHTLLFFLLLVVMLGSQIGIYWWKQNYHKSFVRVSLVGLWVVPILISLYAGFWRMIVMWSLFSACAGYLLLKASRKPLAKETPRQVYRWFYYVYNGCYGLALLGYFIVILNAIGVGLILNSESLGEIGIVMIFYGLYFGVLTRDLAEICTDTMVSVMGFYNKDGLPSKTLQSNMCGICGEDLIQRDAPTPEKTYQLNCKHLYHDFCIRGWTIIGKKDTCPYCNEKVALKEMFTNPWDSQPVLWAQLLDALRYLIVWNPVILLCIQLMLYVLDRPSYLPTTGSS